MADLLELHILQNFAPSNLNRDDTGSPKDALFGGYRRARISSQCLKRAVREYVRDHPGDLPRESLALRTRRLADELAGALAARGRDQAEARQKAALALGGLKLKVDDGDGLTQYLLFLGRREIARIADLIDAHWDQLAAPAAEPDPAQAGARRTARAAKSAGRQALPDTLVKELDRALDGGKALDLALFGRMLADLPQRNQDAACQVAHAISTHAVEREFDFYTAVDDLQTDDNAGAGMMGTIEFASACFYRYIALDLAKLRQNLQGDTELALAGVAALLRALVRAKPSGKQNSFAAHNDPDYIACTIRRDADPRNLANAFERPVNRRDTAASGLTAASVAAFERKWAQLAAAYGQPGTTVTLNLTAAESTLDSAVASLDDLIARAVAGARVALEA